MLQTFCVAALSQINAILHSQNLNNATQPQVCCSEVVPGARRCGGGTQGCALMSPCKTFTLSKTTLFHDMTVVKEEPLVKEEPSFEQPMISSLAKRYAGPYPGWGAPTEAACRVSGGSAKVACVALPFRPPPPLLGEHFSRPSGPV
jgi:hypothetical protein